MLVPRELTDVLEATLPDGLFNDALDAPSEVHLALRVSAPGSKEVSEPALEVQILVILCH